MKTVLLFKKKESNKTLESQSKQDVHNDWHFSKESHDLDYHQGNYWDYAYSFLNQNKNSIKFTEPNLISNYIFEPITLKNNVTVLESFKKKGSSVFDKDWSPKSDDLPENKIWHLKESHSQISKAIKYIDNIFNSKKQKPVIRIAHIDTGYDDSHITFPQDLIDFDYEKNFVEGESQDIAKDTTKFKFPFKHPKHGKGTLSILAGQKINQHGHNGPIGLTKNIQIVPIRIAKSVILLQTQAFVEAINYVIELYDNPKTRVHIVTISMGGLASQAWADVVNKAYEKGIFIVAAAGNNLGRFTPRTLIYPARFNRVWAACGITYDFSPYYKSFFSDFAEMQGNFGPLRCMDTAMAAFTPNMPWAKANSNTEVELTGAGTSSATPQIAIAASLFYLKFFKEINELKFGWQKVEIIRSAFKFSNMRFEDYRTRFDTSTNEINDIDFKKFFGTGILRAFDMVSISDKDFKDLSSKLTMTNRDSAIFPLWDILKSEFFENDSIHEMYLLEIQQLIQMDNTLQLITNHEEIGYNELSLEEKKRFLTRLIELQNSSKNLKIIANYAIKKL